MACTDSKVSGPLSAFVGSLGFPQFLFERISIRRDGPLSHTAAHAFVLYVSTVALRAEENPALDVAVHLSRALNVPVVAHGFFDDRSAHATARRAHFIIDSAREAQACLTAKGIPCTYQIMKNGARQPMHLTLASRAVCVVTDEAFVEPYLTLFGQLKRMKTPFVSVDTSCIYPARLTRAKDCDRAFRFRNATSAARRKRISTPYPPPPSVRPHHSLNSKTVIELLKSLPKGLLYLANDTCVSTTDLLENTQIDVTVPPVTNTKGGTGNGIRRWNTFLAKGLSSYASRRNNPLHHHNQGVSRMSAYLNLGVVSPFRVGREAMARADGKGKSSVNKWLDEYCTWRELAYSFCYHVPNHLDVKTAIPTWAFASLEKHRNDTRKTLSLETLAKAKSGLPLWDIAQESLIRNGELHNNLRMTWGKEVLTWTRGAEEAYEYLKYLNDHFALDGLSPPSYAGLLWCLGWADGPKQERPVFGKVRFRSARAISRRYNLIKLRDAIRSVESPLTRIFQMGVTAPPVTEVTAPPVTGVTAPPVTGDEEKRIPEMFISNSKGLAGQKRKSDGAKDLNNLATKRTKKDEKPLDDVEFDGDKFRGELSLPAC
ncbi:hypothetical protein AAMO2058_000183100 [Amorphochlora amoebiformis]